MSQAVSTTSNNTDNMKNFSGARMSGSSVKGDAKNAANWLRNDFGTVVRDARGRPITKGRKIAYAVRNGCQAALHFGKVIGLTSSGKVQVLNDNKKKITLSFTDRMIAIS